MPRWFKITLWVSGGVFVCGVALVAYILNDLNNIVLDFSQADVPHREARADFVASLEGAQCLTQDMVIAEAETRSWGWLVEPTYQWETCAAAATPWLRVTVEPSMFMSSDNENSAFFVFDSHGCSIDWRDATNCDE